MPNDIKPFARKVLLSENASLEDGHFKANVEYGSNDYGKVLPKLSQGLKSFIHEHAGVTPTAVTLTVPSPESTEKTNQPILVDIHLAEKDIPAFRAFTEAEERAVAAEKLAAAKAAHDPVMEAERAVISEVHARNAEATGKTSEWLEINK